VRFVQNVQKSEIALLTLPIEYKNVFIYN